MTAVDTMNGTLRRVPTWPVYVVGFVPMAWLFWLGATGGLGPEPIKALEHRYGLIGLQLLLAGLCVSPLRRYGGVNLIRFRRSAGLLAFAYVAAHLSVWLLLDLKSWSLIWQDIVKRPYITIGMAGFACLVPLAITSNDASVRWLGPRWRKLHQLTYVAVLLGAVHFVMVAKGWQTEPLVYAGLAGLLVIPRVCAQRMQTWARRRAR